MVNAIQAVLQELRPAIQRDGGDIHFVRFKDGIVYVRLQGACSTCPISFVTLKMGVEVQLKEKVPGVIEVVTVEE